MCDENSALVTEAEHRGNRGIRIALSTCDVDTNQGYVSACEVLKHLGDKVDLGMRVLVLETSGVLLSGVVREVTVLET